MASREGSLPSHTQPVNPLTTTSGNACTLVTTAGSSLRCAFEQHQAEAFDLLRNVLPAQRQHARRSIRRQQLGIRQRTGQNRANTERRRRRDDARLIRFIDRAADAHVLEALALGFRKACE